MSLIMVVETTGINHDGFYLTYPIKVFPMKYDEWEMGAKINLTCELLIDWKIGNIYNSNECA